ncbi:MAG TPA: sulfite exporter TauE/SafE family protein [Segeticoccus sp.]|nr:sulfite exporter TauE/SafE family protein [Segeticoccus sp.]
MSVLEALAIFAAGMAAGTINTIVGSGTLVTFPTLLFFGYPPVVANMSNSVGLVAGGITGVHGYRAELRGQAHVLKRLIPASLVGSVGGALLLLVLPPEAFQTIVPVLIGLSVLLVVVGPWLQRKLAKAHGEQDPVPQGRIRLAVLLGGILFAGAYGGYFGAAQGVLLMGLMSVLMTESLQRINGYKNVLGMVANAVAAVVFMLVAWDDISWIAAGLIAAGALVGGYIGAHVGRRLPPWALRGVIVVIGVAAIVNLLS